MHLLQIKEKRRRLGILLSAGEASLDGDKVVAANRGRRQHPGGAE